MGRIFVSEILGGIFSAGFIIRILHYPSRFPRMFQQSHKEHKTVKMIDKQLQCC